MAAQIGSRACEGFKHCFDESRFWAYMGSCEDVSPFFCFLGCVVFALFFSFSAIPKSKAKPKQPFAWAKKWSFRSW